MADLHLNVKGVYFDAYVAGDKDYEYRLRNNYWIKRLVGREYKNIFYKKGYPKRCDSKNIKIIPYRGYELMTIDHAFFGDDPVDVFAIRLRDQ